MTGRLYLAGVGPGDPELITLKAARVIGEADVVAYLANGDGYSMARDIARTCIGPRTEHMPIEMVMQSDPVAGQEIYDLAAGLIRAKVAAGKRVTYLCEGDPLFYGSAVQLLTRLAGKIDIDVIPGVSSVMMSAAAARMPISVRNDVVRVLPAPLADELLEAELRLGGFAAIIKVGRHIDRVRDLLERLGLLEGAVIVKDASGPKEMVMKLAEFDRGDQAYFSTILCRSVRR